MRERRHGEPRPARLELVASGRARPGSVGLTERARYVPRLAGPLEQLHLVVDGTSVLHRVLALDLEEPYGFTEDEFVSVADLAWPGHAAGSLRQLCGQEPRDRHWDVLEPGRLPLYTCRECGDVYCGALTVSVRREVDPTHGHQVVRWTDLRCEDAHTPAEEMPDVSPVGPFTFDADQYDATLSAAIEQLDELARAEDAARAEWKAQRTLRTRLQRRLRWGTSR